MLTKMHNALVDSGGDCPILLSELHDVWIGTDCVEHLNSLNANGKRDYYRDNTNTVASAVSVCVLTVIDCINEPCRCSPCTGTTSVALGFGAWSSVTSHNNLVRLSIFPFG
jgi:uncharacterized protein YsxB (DUF464 family)